MTKSESPNDNGVEALETEDLIEKAVRGNDWRILNPAQIGEGKFTDRVTVILPCYMGQKELGLTFAGLAKQTYPHHLIEIIVVDDGSNPPIELPSNLPFEVSIAAQERDGFGLARARNLGAKNAKGGILIFLDCDMIPEAQLVEAHARWHHVNKFALTLGFRNHADFSDISPEDLADANGPEDTVRGRNVTSPQWIEFHMRRTENLTSDDSDLFRIATGGNLGVRKSFFEKTGGFDSSFRQWGGEDIEFGFRAFNNGAVLIPERLAKAWHQGSGANPDSNEEASLEQQRHRLSHLIAERTFRDSTPGRSFEIPMIAVAIDSTDQTFQELSVQIDSVLQSSFHDLVIGLQIPESHPNRISIERQYGPDPRVIITGDVLRDVPFAAFYLEPPTGLIFPPDLIHNLISKIGKHGVLKVDTGLIEGIRLAKTRALRRSEQVGTVDFWKGASQLFGEKLLNAEDLGISKNLGKTTAPLGPSLNPPIWQLASKVLKKIISVRSFGDFRNAIEWLFRGFVNVMRRGRFIERLQNFSSRRNISNVPNWLQMAGESAHFPQLKKWNGNSTGVEVVLVAPDVANDWDDSTTRSVYLGEETGIPLAPPFDPSFFNPSGFQQVKTSSQIEKMPEFKRNADFIKKARSTLAVEIDNVDSPESARKIIELSAIGVPVVVKQVDKAEVWLGQQMANALKEVDLKALSDPTKREKASVILRRSALQNHTFANRLNQIRKESGLTTFREPCVSVVIATNRPEMTDRIFKIFEAQDHSNLELILALHGDGFEESYSHSINDEMNVTILRYPKETVFGSVLSKASAIAQGEWIAKMDDDDWYGKEHISDLLLAASYSNADLVGKGSEFVYLTEENLTIRRDLGNSEVESRTLGGGALLVRAETLKQTYGWRELSKGVDVALIDDVVSNGGRVWRTHAFGYLLRRTKGQHTWKVDNQYFLKNADQKWKGFASDLVCVMSE